MKRLFLIIFFGVMIYVAHAQINFIAHRGASCLAPENTVSSAELAWKLGADAVELDIYLTKDNQVMVIHDGNTKRTSGVDYLVKNTTSEALRKLDVGSFKDVKFKGEKIPFLEEMIATIPPGKKLVVELKCGSEVLPFLKDVVKKSGKQDQLIFICFNWQTILDTRKTFAENKCYWLSDSNKGIVEKMHEAAQYKLSGVDLSADIINSETVNLANQLKLDVIAWTVDDPVEAKRLIDLGVNSFTTNRPDWLKVQLQIK